MTFTVRVVVEDDETKEEIGSEIVDSFEDSDEALDLMTDIIEFA